MIGHRLVLDDAADLAAVLLPGIAGDAVLGQLEAERPLLLLHLVHHLLQEVAHRRVELVPPGEIHAVGGDAPLHRERVHVLRHLVPARAIAGRRAGDGAVDHAALERRIDFREADRDRLAADRLDEIVLRAARRAHAPALHVGERGDRLAAEEHLRGERIGRDDAHVEALELLVELRHHGLGDLAAHLRATRAARRGR